MGGGSLIRRSISNAGDYDRVESVGRVTETSREACDGQTGHSGRVESCEHGNHGCLASWASCRS